MPYGSAGAGSRAPLSGNLFPYHKVIQWRRASGTSPLSCLVIRRPGLACRTSLKYDQLAITLGHNTVRVIDAARF